MDGWSSASAFAEAGTMCEDVANIALVAYNSFLHEHSMKDSPVSAGVYQVFEDLTRIRKWTQVVVMAAGSSRPYLCGTAPALFDAVFPERRKAGEAQGGGTGAEDATQVVVPVAVTERLSPRVLRQLCSECVLPRALQGRKARCVTLAVVDDDTTTVYYRLFGELAEVLHPQWKPQRKRKHEDAMHGTAERGDIVKEDEEENEDDDDGSGSD